ncbi:MAG TPA: TlpA family protein disulfide reductase [Chromatiales bacterium]|nr:TlpA family protein disulfide reductase [Chromatiales bacterium]
MRTSVTVLLLVLSALLGPWAVAETQTLPAIEKPFPAPDFTLQSEDEKTYRLSEYRGQVVILNFWATWCPPCRYEMPSMERAWQKIKGKGIVILAVNVGEDADTIFAFTGDYPVTFPLLMDLDGTVINQYRVVGMPTTYIINPDGIVTHRAVGSREWDNKELLATLAAMRSPRFRQPIE